MPKPKLPKNKTRHKAIKVRMTKSEKEFLLEFVKNKNLSVSLYIRKLIVLDKIKNLI